MVDIVITFYKSSDGIRKNNYDKKGLIAKLIQKKTRSLMKTETPFYALKFIRGCEINKKKV